MIKRWIVAVSVVFMFACKDGNSEYIEGNYICQIGSLFNAISHDRKGDFTFPFGARSTEVSIKNNAMMVSGMDIGSYVGHTMTQQHNKKKITSIKDVNVQIDVGDFLYDDGMSIEVFSPKNKKVSLYSVDVFSKKTTSMQLLSNCKTK
ncbi:hypothetical protein [Providencia sp. Me31A]|uniref:hypothetical protein n=1 Tax=Providencia sp. Me31A TaxID=3392637 RepID=UPI003D2C2274